MKCERCLNENPLYFYEGTRGIYCRRCIHLGGHQVESLLEIDVKDEYATMPFELSEDQKRVSKLIAKKGLNENVLVEAVCGAGKTELVIELIEKAFSQKLHVGWMIARRQVVLQLAQRLESIFVEQKVIAVCEGYTDVLEGHLVLLTAHQLYRYPQKFDVLIVDEPDAFPFKNNDLLNDLAKVACKNTKIYLTATPDSTLINSNVYHVFLHRRPHQRDLVVPQVIITWKWCQYLILIVYLFRIYKDERVLIFVPTIRLAKRLSTWLRLPMITSQSENQQEVLLDFDRNDKGKLITTTILERGMTFEEVYVIVIESNHSVFDEASLVQISGRVGRSFEKEKGECIFLGSKKSQAIQKCLQRLHHHNSV